MANIVTGSIGQAAAGDVDVAANPPGEDGDDDDAMDVSLDLQEGADTTHGWATNSNLQQNPQQMSAASSLTVRPRTSSFFPRLV
jgi:phosphoribosylformimino-5-aminoimidazole carboxamide ribonucleotide (ProFAR) isomerase